MYNVSKLFPDDYMVSIARFVSYSKQHHVYFAVANWVKKKDKTQFGLPVAWPLIFNGDDAVQPHVLTSWAFFFILALLTYQIMKPVLILQTLKLILRWYLIDFLFFSPGFFL